MWNTVIDACARRTVLVLCLLVGAVAPVLASSVREVTLDEMLGRTAFVFEGQAMASRVEIGAGGSRDVRTVVTFDIRDVLKGHYAGARIDLSFMGGTVNGRTLRITDMHIPAVGEHGVYFVESLSRRQVNPFYGWSQGHFVVHRDATGVERVTNQRGVGVAGMAPAPASASTQLSGGTARGVLLQRRVGVESALTLSEFKRQLRTRLSGLTP